MIVKLLTEHRLECLTLEEGCRGSSEYTHVKIPHCWKSHSLAQMIEYENNQNRLCYTKYKNNVGFIYNHCRP